MHAPSKASFEPNLHSPQQTMQQPKTQRISACIQEKKKRRRRKRAYNQAYLFLPLNSLPWKPLESPSHTPRTKKKRRNPRRMHIYMHKFLDTTEDVRHNCPCILRILRKTHQLLHVTLKVQKWCWTRDSLHLTYDTSHTASNT